MKDKVKTTKKTSTKKDHSKIEFAIRQTIGQALLGGGTIAFIADHIDEMTHGFAIGIGVIVVMLVLFFINKK